MRASNGQKELLFPNPVSTVDWGGRATRAEVNLEALEANVHVLRSLAPNSELMAVVKADAYGHGAVMTARAALRAGASWLGVYCVDEGLILRQSGIDARIVVFGPSAPFEASLISRYSLTPTVTTLESAAALQQHAITRMPYHLKVDTGLMRAGIAAEDAVSFVSRLADFPKLELEGVFTHFASADEADKTLTLQQLRGFHNTVGALRNAGYAVAVQHVANSAALIDIPEARMDVVRAGIALYGYYPSGEVMRTVRLLPALSLVSAISRLTRVPVGTGVGYGHDFVARRPANIALVPIGYGDGLPRSLGQGRGSVLVRGFDAPIIGRVSMDQITVDVTHVPRVSVGDAITVIGRSGDREQSADDLAAQAGTISYDVLTQLMPRVPRVYVHSGQVAATLQSSTGLQEIDPLNPGYKRGPV